MISAAKFERSYYQTLILEIKSTKHTTATHPTNTNHFLEIKYKPHTYLSKILEDNTKTTNILKNGHLAG